MRGIVVAGTHSGCGKTTIAMGLLAAFKKRGLDVQSFKAGPDFIDSGLHSLITQRPSRNLDLWMCGEGYVRSSFDSQSSGADISVVEGVMGLYDGRNNGRYSTAALAETLGLPVILVIDAYGMAESAGALVKGFVTYRDRGSGVKSEAAEGSCQNENSGLKIAGVIFNRVGSENHYNRLRESVKDVPVLGYLPKNIDFEIPHRHLGLTVAEESPIADKDIQRLADEVSRYIDIDRIIKKESWVLGPGSDITGIKGQSSRCLAPSIRIAVAYDKAFCFYYEDNLDLLRDAGAEIVKFSPLSDKAIPAGIDAVYIGGGYPELYAERLSGNEPMLRSVKEWADAGKPLYAECGGLMFLSQGIYDFEDRFFKMSGIFPFETAMKRERSKIGYREILLKEDCVIGKRGDSLRGHEFHYSVIKPSAASPQPSALDICYSLTDTENRRLNDEGYRYKNSLASYMHIHFGSNPNAANNFVGYVKEAAWKT